MPKIDMETYIVVIVECSFIPKWGDRMSGIMVWIVSLIVLTIMFVGVTGCTNSETVNGSASAISGDKGSKDKVFGGGKFFYEEDFSISGEVTKTRWYNSDIYMYDIKSEKLIVDLPDDGGKLYHIYVTTFDPESKVWLYGGGSYTYNYKNDKFSEDSVGSDIFKDTLIGCADKVKDINESVYVRSTEKSTYRKVVVVDGNLVDAELIDRDIYLTLEIPAPSSTSEDAFKNGEIIRANGRITIKELDVKTVSSFGGGDVMMDEIDGKKVYYSVDQIG